MRKLSGLSSKAKKHLEANPSTTPDGVVATIGNNGVGSDFLKVSFIYQRASTDYIQVLHDAATKILADSSLTYSLDWEFEEDIVIDNSLFAMSVADADKKGDRRLWTMFAAMRIKENNPSACPILGIKIRDCDQSTKDKIALLEKEDVPYLMHRNRVSRLSV